MSRRFFAALLKQEWVGWALIQLAGRMLGAPRLLRGQHRTRHRCKPSSAWPSRGPQQDAAVREPNLGIGDDSPARNRHVRQSRVDGRAPVPVLDDLPRAPSAVNTVRSTSRRTAAAATPVAETPPDAQPTRKRRAMSAEKKKAVSDRMTVYWAERRKKTAK